MGRPVRARAPSSLLAHSAPARSSSLRHPSLALSLARSPAPPRAQVSPWYLAALSPGGPTRLSFYPLLQLSAVKTLRDDPSALLLYAGGRPHLYATPERSEVMRLLAGHLTRLGLTSVISEAAPTAADYRVERAALTSDAAPRVAEFPVLKRTPKSASARPRRLVLTEAALQERDGSTYAVVSARPLASLHAIVRHWDEPQVRRFASFRVFSRCRRAAPRRRRRLRCGGCFGLVVVAGCMAGAETDAVRRLCLKRP